jgi:hypothetical protein
VRVGVVALCAFPVAAALVACATAKEQKTRDEAPRSWHYDAWLDRELETAVVRVCFRDPVPRRLVARARAEAFVEKVVDDITNEPLARDEEGGWRLRSRCARYQIDIAEAARLFARPDLASRFDDAVVVSPELLLLRPARVSYEAELTLEISTWGDREVSAPWPRDARGRYHFGCNAMWWRSYIAVGDLRRERVKVTGGELDVVFVDPDSFGDGEGEGEAALSDEWRRWLQAAGDAVGQMYGSLPVERLQIVVVPVPVPGSSPVMFGMVVRGGHPGALLLVRPHGDRSALVGEWVAVHELSHLALPFVQRRDAWFSEGLASWYQQVLRVRAGLLDERAAFARLADGFEAARDGNIKRVPHLYWAGAAFWLLADVHLRENGSSVDEALRSIRACCFDEPRSIAPREVIVRASQEHPELLRWFEEEAPSVDQAPARALRMLDELGVRRGAGGVTIDDGAPLAHVRAAMVAPVLARATRANAHVPALSSLSPP